MLGAVHKGLQRPRLIELAGAGFNDASRTIKASAACVEARQVDYIKGNTPMGAKALILLDFS